MKIYSDITTEIQNLKRPMIFIALCAVISNILIISLSIYLSAKSHKSSFTPLEFCHSASSSLVNNEISHDFYKEDLAISIGLDSPKLDQIYLLRLDNNYTCSLVTKDSRGLRAWVMSLDKSNSHPLGYIVHSLKEVALVSKYQRGQL